MANFSKAVLVRQDEDRQRALELKQALETIDLKASMSRPGVTAITPTADEQTVDAAKLAKWKDMVQRSKDYAIKQHQIKYQLPEGSPALHSNDSFDRVASGGGPFGKL
jgi:hypothetical protein